MKMSIQANTTILPPKEKKKANAHSKKKEPSPHPSKQANTATFSNKIHLKRNEGKHTLCFFSVFAANKNFQPEIDLTPSHSDQHSNQRFCFLVMMLFV